MHYFTKPRVTIGAPPTNTACGLTAALVEHTEDPRKVTCEACAATRRQPHMHARWDQAKVIKMRRWGHDATTEMDVTLVPVVWPEDGPLGGGPVDKWEVVVDDVWLGSVGRYTGSLDTKIAGTRLRREGKRRTLWSSEGNHHHARSLHGSVSRADAIRDLLR